MNVAILVYSHTGNTLSVANRLKTELASKGITADLLQIKADNDDPNAREFNLVVAPDVSAYQHLVFATPVRGFQISPIMKRYLESLPTLSGKKIACFVTHHFPFAFLGGNQTINAMKKIIAQKGGTVFQQGVIDWSNKKRETQIQDLVRDLSQVV